MVLYFYILSIFYRITNYMVCILQIQDLRDDNHFYNSCKNQNKL